jgi:hypothetical protein
VGAGANVAGLARYFAELKASGGRPDATDPCFVAFLKAFPLVRAADGARFVDLVWAGSVVAGEAGSGPALGAALRALVRDLD